MDDLKERVAKQGEYVAKGVSLGVEGKNLQDALSQGRETVSKRLDFKELGDFFGETVTLMKTLARVGRHIMKTGKHHIQGKIIFTPTEQKELDVTSREQLKHMLKTMIVAEGLSGDQQEIEQKVDTFLADNPDIGKTVNITGGTNSLVINISKNTGPDSLAA